jgi:hypothetical protein
MKFIFKTEHICRSVLVKVSAACPFCLSLQEEPQNAHPYRQVAFGDPGQPGRWEQKSRRCTIHLFVDLRLAIFQMAATWPPAVLSG